MARERSNRHRSVESDEDRVTVGTRVSDSDRRVVVREEIKDDKHRHVNDWKATSSTRHGNSGDRYKEDRKNRYRDEKERERNEGSRWRKETKSDEKDAKKDKELTGREPDSKRKEHSSDKDRNKHRDEKYEKSKEKFHASSSKQRHSDKYRHRDEREKYSSVNKQYFKDERENAKHRDEDNNNNNRGKKRAYENFSDVKGKTVKETKKRLCDEKDSPGDFKGRNDKEIKRRDDDKPIFNNSKDRSVKETDYHRSPSSSKVPQFKGPSRNGNSRQEEEENFEMRDNNTNNWNNNSNTNHWNNNSNSNKWNNNSNSKNWNDGSSSQGFNSYERRPNFQNRNYNNQRSNFNRPRRGGGTNAFFGTRDFGNNYTNNNNNNDINGVSNIPFWPWPQRGQVPAGFHPLANQFPFNMRPENLDLTQLTHLGQNQFSQALDLSQLAQFNQGQFSQTLDLAQLAQFGQNQIPPNIDLSQLTRLGQNQFSKPPDLSQLAPNQGVQTQTLEPNQFEQNHGETDDQLSSDANPNQSNGKKKFPNLETNPEINEPDEAGPPVNSIKDDEDKKSSDSEKTESVEKKTMEEYKIVFRHDYYLSKIGLSEDLAEKDVYEKCMALLQKTGTGTGTIGGSIQNDKEEKVLIKKSSNSNHALKYHLPTRNESLFKRSLSHYKAQILKSFNRIGNIDKEEVLEACTSNPDKMETDEEKPHIEIRAESSSQSRSEEEEEEEDQNATTGVSCKNATEEDSKMKGEDDGEFAVMSGKNVVFASGAQTCELVLPDCIKVGFSQIPC